MELASRVQEDLRRAGWFPGRVDTKTDWVGLYRRHGIELPEHILAFYREFGNLVLLRPASYKLGLHPRWRIPWLVVASWKPGFSFEVREFGLSMSRALEPLLGPTFKIGYWKEIGPHVMDLAGRFYGIDEISGDVIWCADDLNEFLGGKRFGRAPRTVGQIEIPDD